MNTGKRRLIVGGVVAGGLMLGGAGLVIGAGIAKADGSMGDHDAQLYAMELHQHNMVGTPAGARSIATVVCSKRAANSEERVIDAALTDPRMTRAMGVAAVVGAEFHFCPEYYSRAMSPVTE